MKFLQNLLLICLFSGVLFSAFAQTTDSTKSSGSPVKHGLNFVDEDGDGYNDNAPDHDGDGIPNGLDPDWQKLKKAKKAKRFVDLDGDGIDDNVQSGDMEKGKNQMQQTQEKAGSTMEGNGQKQQGQQQKRHGKKE